MDIGRTSNKTDVTSPRVTATAIKSSHVTSSNMTSPDMTSPHMTSSNVTSPHMTSPHMTSPHMMSPDDVEARDEKDTVEVQGVVVKLRKKVARNIEPGGGHEALLSRRMKKSLCGWSQEDISGQFVVVSCLVLIMEHVQTLDASALNFNLVFQSIKKLHFQMRLLLEKQEKIKNVYSSNLIFSLKSVGQIQ